MELKVMEDLPKYLSLDLANIIGSFLKLKYIPRSIITELNQMQSLSIFNKYSCLIILENLVNQGYDESYELYEKLFAQLKKSSVNMNTKLVSRVFSILSKFKGIYKGDKEKSEDTHSLSQFYIDRFNDSVKIAEK